MKLYTVADEKRTLVCRETAPGTLQVLPYATMNDLLTDDPAHRETILARQTGETLALAYFEAYHTDRSVSPSYLQKSADCFQRVIELGVSKAYLYANLYTIYYEQKNYTAAEETLQAYEAAFPEDYMPHAFRGMMLITIENGKAQSKRDYRKALAEYETAGSMIRSSDETSYYQQLESLIQELRRNGWL